MLRSVAVGRIQSLLPRLHEIYYIRSIILFLAILDVPRVQSCSLLDILVHLKGRSYFRHGYPPAVLEVRQRGCDGPCGLLPTFDGLD